VQDRPACLIHSSQSRLPVGRTQVLAASLDAAAGFSFLATVARLGPTECADALFIFYRFRSIFALDVPGTGTTGHGSPLLCLITTEVFS
jgi:hypothetical protein